MVQWVGVIQIQGVGYYEAKLKIGVRKIWADSDKEFEKSSTRGTLPYHPY